MRYNLKYEVVISDAKIANNEINPEGNPFNP